MSVPRNALVSPGRFKATAIVLPQSFAPAPPSDGFDGMDPSDGPHPPPPTGRPAGEVGVPPTGLPAPSPWTLRVGNDGPPPLFSSFASFDSHRSNRCWGQTWTRARMVAWP